MNRHQRNQERFFELSKTYLPADEHAALRKEIATLSAVELSTNLAVAEETERDIRKLERRGR